MFNEKVNYWDYRQKKYYREDEVGYIHHRLREFVIKAAIDNFRDVHNCQLIPITFVTAGAYYTTIEKMIKKIEHYSQ